MKTKDPKTDTMKLHFGWRTPQLRQEKCQKDQRCNDLPQAPACKINGKWLY